MPKSKKRSFRGNQYSCDTPQTTAATTIPDAADTTTAIETSTATVIKTSTPTGIATSTTTTIETSTDVETVSPTTINANTSASLAKLSNSLHKSAQIFTSKTLITPDSVIVQTKLILRLMERLASGKMACPDHPTAPPTITVEPSSGIVCVFKFTCSYCGVLVESNKMSEKDANNRFTLNTQLAFGTILAGGHRSTAETIAVHLGLPPPVTLSEWAKDMEYLREVTSKVADRSMYQAAEEAVEAVNDTDITVSCDGTWQRRGFSSKNGVATVITHSKDKPGKVIDVEVMSSYCFTCSRYDDDAPKHNCTKNHQGTAGSMETTGMVRIFCRSLEKRGTRYLNYLGDGDSKAFSAVKDAMPYGPDTTIEKLECVGHVQKRMGTMLLSKVEQCKGKEFSWRGRKHRGIGGLGKLNKSTIMAIQVQYGIAIRNNIGDLEGMKRCIWAIWHHKNKNHSDCGTSCPAVNGTGDGNANSLPIFVLNEIKPVFETLSEKSLLKKCLHGGTQNNNESFHKIIWSYCSKNQFVQRCRLELAVNCAVVHFNDGVTNLSSVYNYLNISVGQQLAKHLYGKDFLRVGSAQKLLGKEGNGRRKRKISSKPDNQDYQAGAF